MRRLRVATYTTSTSGSSTSFSYEPYDRATSSRPAKSLALSSLRDPTATTSASSTTWRSRANAAAMPPVPMMPQRVRVMLLPYR